MPTAHILYLVPKEDADLNKLEEAKQRINQSGRRKMNRSRWILTPRKKRFLSIMVVALSLVLICWIAHHDNDRKDAMAEAYLNKIWIAGDWTEGFYKNMYLNRIVPESDWKEGVYKGIAFCFVEMEDGKCEGELVRNDTSFFRREGKVFSGTFHDNVAECRFIDFRKRTGTVKFTFVNENEIEVFMSYDEGGIVPSRTFRPYNIKDLEDFILQEEQTVQVDLELWGNVYFVAGIGKGVSDKPVPRAYLVNENYDILHQFEPALYRSGEEIYDAVFEDVNGDGLTDATVFTHFVDRGRVIEGMPLVSWLFLQSDNGMYDFEAEYFHPEEPVSEGNSNTEESTWKQEYENCMKAMELGISERGMAGQQEPENFKKKAWNRVMELWQDSLRAFGACVATCVRNQPGGMDGEEDVYRTATLLMTAMCEENGGSYEFRYGHGEDTAKAQEDFRAVIEGENPIDESMDLLYGDFGIYYYADALIIEMGREAWQEEFFHCLDMVRNRVRESGDGDKEQLLETLEALEDFFGVWTENERACKWLEYHEKIGVDDEERNEWIKLEKGELRIWQAESEAEIFRTGTLLLIDGLERSGGSYEFIYKEDPDRQELTKLLGIRPGTEEGTWKQEYELCLAAMELAISRYDVTGADIPYENLPDFEKRASDRSMELWRDAISAFAECVETCVRNQPGGTEGEEDIYRTAVLLMKVMCESRNGHYTLAHEHGEDLEKAQEDFRTVIRGENPIDEYRKSFYEEFDSYIGIDSTIADMIAEAWQGEFYHCLNTVRDRVRQDPVNKQQLLKLLEGLEDFLEVWAEDEGRYDCIESGSGLRMDIAGDRAKVFRTGTLLLIDGLEQSGGSYEFIYDGEADRQTLINNCEGTRTDAGAERMYRHTISVHSGIGFDARQGIVISPGSEDLEDSVPEELILELSAALQNDTLEDYVAGISAEYALLQEDEIMRYVRKDTSGILESFYFDYMEDGWEWFRFGRDNGIIVRQKINHEKYPYCYYQFPCEGKLYGPAICAYGKNEDCYFISWEDNDYLVVTRREEGQVKGIAVYQRYSATQSEWQSNNSPTGWIMGLEKTSDGEIQVTLYTYVYVGGYFWGRFLDY